MSPSSSGRLIRLIPTILGPLHAEASPAGITRLAHAGAGTEDTEPMAGRRPGRAARHLDRLSDELEEYLDGKRRDFSVPVDWLGAGVDHGFAREVYREIQAVPYGDTASYGQISFDAGRPRHARQVGRLCARVPVVYLIPVHRITRADGGLGACPQVRRALLAHERLNIDSARSVAITPY